MRTRWSMPTATATCSVRPAPRPTATRRPTDSSATRLSTWARRRQGSKFFNGDLGAAFEQNQRQLAVRNFDNQGVAPRPLAGLTVTRKFYVDPSGYFGRYLEVFDNPTSAPISVDVQITGNLNATRFVATSDGDATLTNADRWFTTDRPALAGSPNDAIVFQGPGAPLAVADAGVTTSFVVAPFVRWNGLTVPAGGRAIIMHFAAAPLEAAASRAVAERLAQAPPEALAGLSPADIAAIRNFAIPADGSSSVTPFATVSGRVLANGVAAVPNAIVSVGGNSSPIFNPTVAVKADANGFYSATTLDEGPFTVQAKDPTSGALTSVVSLSMAQGQTTVTQDLSFDTLGVLRGSVRFGSGAAASSGTVTITGGSPAVNVVVPIAGDGTYSGVALPAGTLHDSGGLARPQRDHDRRPRDRRCHDDCRRDAQVVRRRARHGQALRRHARRQRDGDCDRRRRPASSGRYRRERNRHAQHVCRRRTLHGAGVRASTHRHGEWCRPAGRRQPHDRCRGDVDRWKGDRAGVRCQRRDPDSDRPGAIGRRQHRRLVADRGRRQLRDQYDPAGHLHRDDHDDRAEPAGSGSRRQRRSADHGELQVPRARDGAGHRAARRSAAGWRHDLLAERGRLRLPRRDRRRAEASPRRTSPRGRSRSTPSRSTASFSMSCAPARSRPPTTAVSWTSRSRRRSGPSAGPSSSPTA